LPASYKRNFTAEAFGAHTLNVVFPGDQLTPSSWLHVGYLAYGSGVCAGAIVVSSINNIAAVRVYLAVFIGLTFRHGNAVNNCTEN